MMSHGVDPRLSDYRYLKWSHRRNSSGTVGTFLKAYEERYGKKIYYKMSDFDYERGVIGHECINEIIADRLFYLLGIDHLNYRLLHAKVEVDGKEFETWISASDDFKRPGESKIALDDFYDLFKRENETRMQFMKRMGWEGLSYLMYVADFLIINRDRHGANIEVLKDGESYRMAPLFDHGLSFLFSCKSDEEAERFDPMRDVPVQGFTGSRSLFENVKSIPVEKLPRLRRLEEDDRSIIFENLDKILSPSFLDKIWEIIMKRWQYYENLRHQG